MAALFERKAMRYLLVNDAAVSNIVGTRVITSDSDEGVRLPYGILRGLGRSHIHHMGAASGVVQPRIQLDWYAITTALLEDLMDKARLALDGRTGVVTVDGSTITFSSLHLKNEQTSSERGNDDSDRVIKRGIQEYDCTVFETVPTFS